MNSTIRNLGHHLEQQGEVLLVAHANPDGDSIGSQAALSQALITQGLQVTCAGQDPIPENYRFLAGLADYRLVNTIVSIPPTVIYLDCADERRVGEEMARRLGRPATVINIDHHESNTNFGDINLVDPLAAATGELIIEILQNLGWSIPGTAATALYVSLIMDTGSFQYANTTPRTLNRAAELIELGAEVVLARQQLFENHPWAAQKLLGRALEKMQLTGNNRIAYMIIDQQAMAECGATDEMTEGLVNYARAVKGVEIGLLFREVYPGRVRISFRSKDKVNVNHLAANFDGGGHWRAAGATMDGSLQTVVEKVIKAAMIALQETEDGA